MKNLLLILVLISTLVSCNNPSSSNKNSAFSNGTNSVSKISGKTMGTSYNITSDLTNLTQIKSQIDALLKEINNDVSTYEADSFISLFNKAEERVVLQNTRNYEKEHPHFKINYDVARVVYQKSRAAFDPTVMPLVNYWGFGPNKKNPDQIDETKLQAIRADVGFVKVNKNTISKDQKKYLIKDRPGIQLDFSALAKGYAVDKVAELLEKAGSTNHLVEIGGEVKVKGYNAKNEFWLIGINRPEMDAALNSVFKKMQLTDMAMASSGNYRNYFKLDDKIYSHTINPRTGYPEQSKLLSTTILAKDCIYADAYATACMVLGLEEGRELIDSIDGVEAYFIYTDEKGQLAELQTNGASFYLVD